MLRPHSWPGIMRLRILVVIVICDPLGRRSGPEIPLVELRKNKEGGQKPGDVGGMLER